jgi:hypothetical protein
MELQNLQDKDMVSSLDRIPKEEFNSEVYLNIADGSLYGKHSTGTTYRLDKVNEVFQATGNRIFYYYDSYIDIWKKGPEDKSGSPVWYLFSFDGNFVFKFPSRLTERSKIEVYVFDNSIWWLKKVLINPFKKDIDSFQPQIVDINGKECIIQAFRDSTSFFLCKVPVENITNGESVIEIQWELIWNNIPKLFDKDINSFSPNTFLINNHYTFINILDFTDYCKKSKWTFEFHGVNLQRVFEILPKITIDLNGHEGYVENIGKISTASFDNFMLVSKYNEIYFEGIWLGKKQELIYGKYSDKQWLDVKSQEGPMRFLGFMDDTVMCKLSEVGKYENQKTKRKHGM